VRDTLNKIVGLQLKRSWQWLLYLDLILPGILFSLAYFLPQAELAVLFARLYHSYSMYVSNPIPNLTTFMGLVGLAIHLWALGYAFKGKNRIDLFLSVIITLAITLYYYFGINYELVRLLNFY